MVCDFDPPKYIPERRFSGDLFFSFLLRVGVPCLQFATPTLPLPPFLPFLTVLVVPGLGR